MDNLSGYEWLYVIIILMILSLPISLLFYALWLFVLGISDLLHIAYCRLRGYAYGEDDVRG